MVPVQKKTPFKRGLEREAYRKKPEAQLKNAVIYFPERGAELLKKQIPGLGIERHDDLADAFTTLLPGMRDMSMEKSNSKRNPGFDGNSAFVRMLNEHILYILDPGLSL